MIEELATLLEAFPGPENQTQCFTHILNLVVQTVIKQFDLPKAQDPDGTDLDVASEELLKLAGELEDEINEDKEGEDDNIEGWVDERETMEEGELKELDNSVQPVRLLLTKVTFLLIPQHLRKEQ